MNDPKLPHMIQVLNLIEGFFDQRIKETLERSESLCLDSEEDRDELQRRLELAIREEE